MTRIVNLVVVGCLGCLVVGVVGCVSAPQMGTQSSPLPVSKTDLGEQPDWFLESPQAPDYLYAATTQTSKDMQMAIDKATMSGREEISRQMEAKLETLRKRFEEDTGLGSESSLLQNFDQAGRVVSSETLSGSYAKSKKTVREDQVWRAYVLVEYPIGEANRSLMKKIKASKEMYTRFRATKAFEELDKEVEKFEGSKKSQSQP